METTWKPFSQFLAAHSEQSFVKYREKYGIKVETTPNRPIPPLMTRFRQMRLPKGLIDYLKTHRNVTKPTPIQMQSIPAILLGMDLIGVAPTGSGKSLAFSLPLVLKAIEMEESMRFEPGEGPFGLIVVPSRELASQIYDQIVDMADWLYSKRYARIRTVLCIGGAPMSEQAHRLGKGVHIVVATPGRLLDLLEKKALHLQTCRYFCLDEADRMVDLGFETELRRILGYFPDRPKQTLLFSATMPATIRTFASTALVDPIVVNVGRAGSACKNIKQCIEWIPLESRLEALLEALQKTAPPVIIFSQNKFDVNDIHEFLLRKGVEAVGIHGAKTQEERSYAIDAFKKGRADVLVATDVASKGLDFPAIQHVINFDMPKEIEDYVHRIGRTGRGGQPGLATTFVNGSCSKSILLDLKHLMIEAEQDVPPFLNEIDGAAPTGGCSICGGLGHVEASCPKQAYQTAKLITQMFGQE